MKRITPTHLDRQPANMCGSIGYNSRVFGWFSKVISLFKYSLLDIVHKISSNGSRMAYQHVSANGFRERR